MSCGRGYTTFKTPTTFKRAFNALKLFQVMSPPLDIPQTIGRGRSCDPMSCGKWFAISGTHTHAHTFSLTHTLSLSLSLSHTLSLSLPLTHTHPLSG